MSTLKVAAINNPSASSGGLAISTGGNVTGAGLDLITTQSFSAVSSVSVNNCFTATYDNYRVFAAYVASTSAITNMRFRAAGSDNTAAAYQLRIADVGAFTNGSVSDQNTSALITASTGGNGLSIDVISPALAQYTTCPYTAQSALFAVAALARFGVMSHLAASSFDGFTLYQASGTITGTVSVYGYKK